MATCRRQQVAPAVGVPLAAGAFEITMTLLDTIRRYGPSSTALLWADIVVMRKASPCDDLPKSEAALLECLRALEKVGSVRLGEKGWEACYETAKREPQAQLF